MGKNDYKRGQQSAFWGSKPNPPPRSGLLGGIEDLFVPGTSKKKDKAFSDYSSGYADERRRKKGR